MTMLRATIWLAVGLFQLFLVATLFSVLLHAGYQIYIMADMPTSAGPVALSLCKRLEPPEPLSSPRKLPVLLRQMRRCPVDSTTSLSKHGARDD
jgi:hypothetical protein